MMRRSQVLSVVFSFFIISVLLSSCGGGGDTIIETGSVQSTVTPLYSANGNNWNDYIKNDGSDLFNATDTVCDPAATDTTCIHAGEILSMVVPGRSSCAGLTATDRLDAFNWSCDNSVNPVRFVSTGFQADQGLSDLIDFNSATFAENFLLVWESGSVIAASSPAVWWNNPVVVNNDGSNGADMNIGEIHIITRNANATYVIGADKVGLLVKPGVILTGSATLGEDVVSADTRNFVWVEGVVDGTGDLNAISFSSTRFSVINNVSAVNASQGVYLLMSANNKLNKLYVENSNSFGIIIFNSSDNNALSNIICINNGDTGVILYSSRSNTLNNITTTGHQFEGVLLTNSSYDNTLNNITAYNNVEAGISLSSSGNNILSNITVSSNSNDGLFLGLSSNNILNNITSADNGRYGSHLLSSSDNRFTGQFQVGNNTTLACFVSGGTNPGLTDVTCANQGSSDAVLTTGVSTTGSFVDSANNVFSLLQSDMVIRDVLALPTGNDTYNHSWFDSSSIVTLRNAIEIGNDGIGNDNLLCESNEACLYTPNIAAYQGHGDLISAGPFTDGTITGVTLKKYESNGY